MIAYFQWSSWEIRHYLPKVKEVSLLSYLASSLVLISLILVVILSNQILITIRLNMASQVVDNRMRDFIITFVPTCN